MTASYARKLPCFNAESQQGRRNDLPSTNYLHSSTTVVLTLDTQHHVGKKTSQRAIMRKALPLKIDLKSNPTKPTLVANDYFLRDVLVRKAHVSDHMDQRSSSCQNQHTTKNTFTNNYLLSTTVSVLSTMSIRLANRAFFLINNLYIC